jgi:dTDP-4-dehydrorhamnose reductase
MKVIILGYNSFVGSSLSNFFNEKAGVDLVYVGRKISDVCDVIQFEVPAGLDSLNAATSSLLSKLNIDKDSVIINCISMGDVDRCENNKEECEIQNYYFVKTLYESLAGHDFRRLIHFSTNAVYCGEKAPYDERSDCNPVNFYGVTKLKTDEFLLQQNDERVIVARPITMYGKALAGGRANPVSMIIEKLMKEEKIKLVDDVYVNILFVDDLATAIGKLLDINYSGLINISGDDVYSRYELGVELAQLLGKGTSMIEAVASKGFKTVARRPLNTSFDNSLMKSLGVQPHSLRQAIPNLI